MVGANRSMTSYIMIISILIHIITLIAVYLLNKQYKRISRMTRKNAISTSEIMDIMKNYLEEIKQENKLLQQEVLKFRDAQSSKPEKSEPVEIEQKKMETMKPVIETPPILEEQEEIEKEELPFQFQREEVQDKIEVSLHSRILKLYKEGFTVEEIARTLGCGKTEAELIIKIYEKSNI